MSSDYAYWINDKEILCCYYGYTYLLNIENMTATVKNSLKESDLDDTELLNPDLSPDGKRVVGIKEEYRDVKTDRGSWVAKKTESISVVTIEK